MLDRVRAFFSIRVRNRNLAPGQVIDTRFGKAEIVGGAINLHLLDCDRESNVVARNGGGFSISLKELNQPS